ncbi:CASP-like protein 5C3 isoform X4 [Diospyros lotus]|uniref:CASP-like protein 5C3 isoform X4 n=1 Tax=Diospyros lotus TaxID=55363 RepID=UPI00224DD64C|nr:CASP-like protein 5C3 isoform X4 [Diospyros lotus]
MDELPGALGTSASLALRLGQFIFSIASLIFMCLDVHFYAYTAFWYLATNCFYQKQLNSKSSTSIYGPCASFSVTIMSLMIPWSLTLAVVDVYFVLCSLVSVAGCSLLNGQCHRCPHHFPHSLHGKVV